MKLPLILTLSRLFICPIFLVLYLYHRALGIEATLLPFILIGLVVISDLSDFFDGYIARKWNMVTDLGKILDPMADSVARITVLITFTQGAVQLPILLIFIFIYREAMINTLRIICGLRGIALAARKSGKIKTVIQGVVVLAILILMIPYSYGALSLTVFRDISFYMVLFAAIYTIFSGVEYLYANKSLLRETWSKSKISP